MKYSIEELNKLLHSSNVEDLDKLYEYEQHIQNHEHEMKMYHINIKNMLIKQAELKDKLNGINITWNEVSENNLHTTDHISVAGIIVFLVLMKLSALVLYSQSLLSAPYIILTGVVSFLLGFLTIKSLNYFRNKFSKSNVRNLYAKIGE